MRDIEVRTFVGDTESAGFLSAFCPRGGAK